MLIRRASFKKLHGHITTDLKFFPSVNVLIGVNGSGKTTILNAMTWTLSPDFQQGGFQAAYLLSTLVFDEITITFTLPRIRRHQRVTAKHEGDSIRITVRDIDGAFLIPVIGDFENLRITTSPRPREIADIVANSLNEQRGNAVLQYLRTLPGPLYLPLDRRWTETEEPRHTRTRIRRLSAHGHLPIYDVIGSATSVHRTEQNATEHLNYELRNDLLLYLFEAPVASGHSDNLMLLPIQELQNHKRRIVTTLDRLGIPDAESKTQQFFVTLEDAAKRLEGRDMNSIGPDDPEYRTWVNWVVYGSPLAQRVQRVVALIEEYENKQMSITKPSRSFLDSVNQFLSDSGKRLQFSETDGLAVILADEHITDPASLSSGELQLLTLFAFLYVQFEQQEEFTIIIDEPELSLHLAWQSRYLEALTTANPQAQFIVATHSPELAASFENAIIDISPERR